MRNVLLKVSFVLPLILLNAAFANTELHNQPLTNKQLIGKWQCHIKTNDDAVKQINEVQFFKNGTLQEKIRIEYGQKSEYDYQIESAIATANWQIVDELLAYTHYKIGTYKVQMPNAKDDANQAVIAMEKTLPIVQAMMNHRVDKRSFVVGVLNKRAIMMNDVKNALLMNCRKKGWFGF